MAVDRRSFKGRLLFLFKRYGGGFHRMVYRWSGGRLLGTARGVPILLLTTTGRKSGKRRTVPLVYDQQGESFVVASSNAGHWEPAWLLNLRDDPHVIVEVGSRRFNGVAEIAEGEQGNAMWAEYERLHPTYPKYRTGRGVDIPMVTLRPAVE